MISNYNLLWIFLFIIIGYYSIKYLFFIIIGLLIGFYISYMYFIPSLCNLRTNK